MRLWPCRSDIWHQWKISWTNYKSTWYQSWGKRQKFWLYSSINQYIVSNKEAFLSLSRFLFWEIRNLYCAYAILNGKRPQYHQWKTDYQPCVSAQTVLQTRTSAAKPMIEHLTFCCWRVWEKNGQQGKNQAN